MRIPSSYRLMAHTIKVKRIPPCRWKDEKTVGLFSTEHKRIEIRDTCDTLTEHVFLHELTHSILDAMGHPLNRREDFVDQFSGLLHQVLTTAKYPEPRPPRRTRKRTSAKANK